jgi:hypothetical protein
VGLAVVFLVWLLRPAYIADIAHERVALGHGRHETSVPLEAVARVQVLSRLPPITGRPYQALIVVRGEQLGMRKWFLLTMPSAEDLTAVERSIGAAAPLEDSSKT